MIMISYDDFKQGWSLQHSLLGGLGWVHARDPGLNLVALLPSLHPPIHSITQADGNGQSEDTNEEFKGYQELPYQGLFIRSAD